MTPQRRTPAPMSAAEAREPGLLGAPAEAAHQPGSFWAKITGNAAGTNRYAWTQVDEGDVSDFDATLADAFAATGGSAANEAPAYEINSRTDVPTGTRVKLWPAGNLTYYLFAAPAVDEAGSSAAAACGWLVGLESTDCLLLTVVSASGRCSGIDAGQEIYLETSGAGQWTSTEDFAHTGAGTPGPVVFTSAGPALTIDGVSGTYLGCGGGQLLFAFGGTTLCGGVAAQCENFFVVGLACSCCPIDGWGGEGWYCVEDTGPSDCEPVELLDEDKCDTSIVICSGPYATEAEAEAVCGTVVTTCCGADEVPTTLTAAFSAGAPDADVTLTYNSGTGKWHGTGPLCGFAGTHVFECLGPGNSWKWTFTRNIGGGQTSTAAATCSPFSWVSSSQSPFAEPENTCSAPYTVTIS